MRPDHLAGQIAALVLVSIVLFHVAATIAFNFLDRDHHGHAAARWEAAAAMAAAIDFAPVADRAQLLAELSRASRWLRFSLGAQRPPLAEAGIPEAQLTALRAHLWPAAELFATDPAGRAVALALRKGGFLTISLVSPAWGGPGPAAGPEPGPPPGGRAAGPPPAFGAPPGDGPPPPRPPPGPRGDPLPGDRPFLPSPGVWITSGLFFLLCAAILTAWASAAVVAPLVELARRAEKFPCESGVRDLLPEKGPQEVRDLTKALNRMQDRIYSMMSARSRALAAISHDLRTIITRMRLRSEFIEDQALRAKMLHDAELMDSMLCKNLVYLRDEDRRPTQGVVDLDSVLQTIVDQFADIGREVSYESGGRRMVRGSVTDLQRIFANLVENAAAHGRQIAISVHRPAPGSVRVDVADDGPGIADADKQKVFEPFVRGQPARNMNEHGGFGLGLSIVRALLEEAGGALELVDREPHGLIARVTLRAAGEASGS
nr:ATP-binding protein [Methylosinus sp. Sm6]